MITKKSIESALGNYNSDFTEGLIIRTLPNDDSKKSRRYEKNPPPYFSIEAMKLIKDLNVKHLLVDIPSVDRSRDSGRLTAHHIYWDVAQGTHNVDRTNHSLNTITEMIYVPNTVGNGKYMLNLQIAPFTADAAPSRPVIYIII
jgi:arylformamidase